MNNILLFQNTISITLFLTGIFFLLFRYKGNLSRLLLALSFFIWLLRFLAGFCYQISEEKPAMLSALFSPAIIIFGSLIVIPILLYVIEIIRPGWITWKRSLYIFFPWLCTSVFYFLTLKILNEPITDLHDFQDLRSNFSSFNVWFRFVMLSIMFVYLVMLHTITTHYKSYYDKWCMDNFSNTEEMNISWMIYICIGLWLNTLAYILCLFELGNIPFICHQVIIQVTFSIVLYNSLFHKDPYPKHFFRNTMEEEQALMNEISNEPTVPDENDSFENHLEEYKQTIKEWFQSSEPFLQKDFKLQDVGDILPLNRTYLSKIFNEGFEESFSQMVAHYRVEKAKELLHTHSDMTIKEIAAQCGFTSSSVFNPIFLKKVGISPKKYRENQ